LELIKQYKHFDFKKFKIRSKNLWFIVNFH
jgi:hypothetical protein